MPNRNRNQNNRSARDMHAPPTGVTEDEQKKILQDILNIIPENVKSLAEESLSRPSRNTNNSDPYAPPVGMTPGDQELLIKRILEVIPQSIRQSAGVISSPKPRGGRGRGRRR